MYNPYDISRFIQPTYAVQQPVVMPVQQPVYPMIGSSGFSSNKEELITIVLIIIGIIITIYIAQKYIFTNNNIINQTDQTQDNYITNQTDQIQNNYINPSMPPKRQSDPLGDAGWEVIVTDTCPFCIKQKEVLNKYFPNFKNIYNNKPASVVPTWVNSKCFDKNNPTEKLKIQGYQDYQKLINMIDMAC